METATRTTRRDACKPDDDRPDSPARWIKAYERAVEAGLMIRPGLFGGLWTVTSKSRPDLCYAVDATHCGCTAAELGDPVCMHRSLYRAIHNMLPELPAEIPANVVFLHRRQSSPPAA